MTNKKDNPIYEHNTIEFVTIAVEYCSFLESASSMDAVSFVDKSTKLLPILYLKATLLPVVELYGESAELETYVTEDMYEALRRRIAGLLGEHDSYLETFHPDMPFSDTPIAAFISENLSDVYQSLGDFCHVFRQGHEEAMREAMEAVSESFRLYWGMALLSALKALHAIRYEIENDYEDF
ncbi:MAG: DUF5063 domain-containing protein [Tannerellaceae bacterium]|jgi:hypothetical protein|nr:DUF5063 domain-containing protein [Tannerellaceae bacterium]